MFVPDETDLLAFFESEPIERQKSDGLYCFQAKDKQGFTILVSFNLLEASFQIRLSVNGNDVVVISEEGAESISLEKDGFDEYMVCSFKLGSANSKAEIRIRPNITVNWYTLMV